LLTVGATAVVIRYTEGTAAHGGSPSWGPLAAPRLSVEPDAEIPGTVAPPAWPTQVISVPWAAYTLLPSMHYIAIGAIVLREVNQATLLVDLMERAIAMGGHDIINVRLAVTERGAVTVATAVVIQYTDETVYVAPVVLPAVLPATLPAAAQAEEPGAQEGGFVSLLPRAARTQRPPREGPPVNWLSLEVSALAAGARYARDINNALSISGNVFAGSLNGVFNEDRSAGASVAMRLSPWDFPFYFELGLGVGRVEYREEERRWVDSVMGGGHWQNNEVHGETVGFMVTPAVGARFDVGQEGGFFLNPFLSLPLVMGGGARPIFSRIIGVGAGLAW